MRRQTRFVPRNTAEGVALFVAATLIVAAVFTAVDAGAASPLPSPSVTAEDVEPDASRSAVPGTAERTASPSETISVLGRIPVSTSAPLASAETDGTARAGKGQPATREQDPSNLAAVPWLGVPAPTTAPTPAASPRPSTSTPTTTEPDPSPTTTQPTPSPTSPPTTPSTPAEPTSPPDTSTPETAPKSLDAPSDATTQDQPEADAS